MGHRSKTKSIKAKAPSSSKRVPAHHVAKSYHVPESATEIPKDSVNRRIVFRFDCVDLEADCPWSLAHMSDEEHRLLLLKMRDFEKATVGEIISPSYQAFTCYPDFTILLGGDARYFNAGRNHPLLCSILVSLRA